MIVYVAVQWFGDGQTEADVLGVYSKLSDARHDVENYTDWDPDLCDTDELLWGIEEYSVQIIGREVD